MGGVSFDQNCYAGDSTAHYIAGCLAFPHTSIKRKVFVFTGAPYYSGNYSCRIPTGQNPKVMHAAETDLYYCNRYVQERHFVKSSVPKIRSQSVFFWLALKIKSEAR